jgi:hypothetical protein
MPEFPEETLDLLHAGVEPDSDAPPCHWTDCPLDEGHDGPHDSPQVNPTA